MACFRQMAGLHTREESLTDGALESHVLIALSQQRAIVAITSTRTTIPISEGKQFSFLVLRSQDKCQLLLVRIHPHAKMKESIGILP